MMFDASHGAGNSPFAERFINVETPAGNREIPVVSSEGEHGVGVFFIPGMGGSIYHPITKGLMNYAAQQGYPFASFGYPDFLPDVRLIKNFSLVRMQYDAMAAFLQLTKDPQIIVAHSYGTNPALRLALDNPDKVKGLILVSPGVNVFRDLVGPIVGRNERSQQKFEDTGTCDIPVLFHDKDGGESLKLVRTTRDILEAGVAAEIFREAGQITLQCPALILHDQSDERIPYASALALSQKINLPGEGMNGGPRHPRVIRVIGAGHDHKNPIDALAIWGNAHRLLESAMLG